MPLPDGRRRTDPECYRQSSSHAFILSPRFRGAESMLRLLFIGWHILKFSPQKVHPAVSTATIHDISVVCKQFRAFMQDFLRFDVAGRSLCALFCTPTLPADRAAKERVLLPILYNVRGRLRQPCIFDSIYPSATSSTIMTLKPTAKNTVPRLECSPCDISGISSSTTT